MSSDSVLLIVSSSNSWKIQHIKKNLQVQVKYMRKKLRSWFSGSRMNKLGQKTRSTNWTKWKMFWVNSRSLFMLVNSLEFLFLLFECISFLFKLNGIFGVGRNKRRATINIKGNLQKPLTRMNLKLQSSRRNWKMNILGLMLQKSSLDKWKGL